MARLITLNKLLQNGDLCVAPGAINCDSLRGAPRAAWILRRQGLPALGITYDITTDVTKTDANSIAGVLIDTDDQGQIFVDTASINNIINACDNCCDTVNGNVVSNVLAGVLPAFVDPAASIFCITRTDDGGPYAIQKANLDYQGKVDTLRHVSNAAGVSKYQVTGSAAPLAVGTDVIAAGACP